MLDLDSISHNRIMTFTQGHIAKVKVTVYTWQKIVLGPLHYHYTGSLDGDDTSRNCCSSPYHPGVVVAGVFVPLGMSSLSGGLQLFIYLAATTCSGRYLRPIHTREPINPRSLPLWKNGRISNERALIRESVRWSKIQRGLVGPALRGRVERDQFFSQLKMVGDDPALHRSYVEQGQSLYDLNMTQTYNPRASAKLECLNKWIT